MVVGVVKMLYENVSLAALRGIVANLTLDGAYQVVVPAENVEWGAKMSPSWLGEKSLFHEPVRPMTGSHGIR